MAQSLTLLSIRSAAKIHGINYRLLLKAVHSGRVKTISLSGRPRVSAEALASFVNTARVEFIQGGELPSSTPTSTGVPIQPAGTDG